MPAMKSTANASDPIVRAREALRARGMRWTPQRRALLQVLVETSGHVTGVELIERARLRDPETTASTVYRTLGVLEQLGLVSHSHGHDGREEFHLWPAVEHAHLACTTCLETWEIEGEEALAITQGLAQTRGFTVQLSHLTISGLCRECLVANQRSARNSPQRVAGSA
jgi:Fur family transcriptional regulator, ferric uptake regulator